jgi:hypothetical protein
MIIEPLDVPGNLGYIVWYYGFTITIGRGSDIVISRKSVHPLHLYVVMYKVPAESPVKIFRIWKGPPLLLN